MWHTGPLESVVDMLPGASCPTHLAAIPFFFAAFCFLGPPERLRTRHVNKAQPLPLQRFLHDGSRYVPFGMSDAKRVDEIRARRYALRCGAIPSGRAIRVSSTFATGERPNPALCGW
jgi:hypothetical protein